MFFKRGAQMKHAIFVTIILSFILNGCSNAYRFYVCPHEFSEEVKSKNNIGEKKEVLAKKDYRVLVINNKKIPVQHFRPEHTFGNLIHPRDVSFENPLTLTSLIIVEQLNFSYGIALKKLNDNNWRIHWIQDADVEDIRNEGLVYLPHYEDLPYLWR